MTWYIQQDKFVKISWPHLKQALVQNFAPQNVTQIALHQLQKCEQNLGEQLAQFVVKLTQILLRADPNMTEAMKLYFLWLRLCHDIFRRVKDQGPTSFHDVIQIAQRIDANLHDEFVLVLDPLIAPKIKTTLDISTPMDINVQHAQVSD